MNPFVALGLVAALLILPFLAVYLLRGVRQRAIERDEKWLDENRLDAFRIRHPGAIQGGRFTCPHCEGTRIFVRTYRDSSLREHVCNMCGTSLYFSGAGY